MRSYAKLQACSVRSYAKVCEVMRSYAKLCEAANFFHEVQAKRREARGANCGPKVQLRTEPHIITSSSLVNFMQGISLMSRSLIWLEGNDWELVGR